jgi:hypothetical protein
VLNNNDKFNSKKVSLERVREEEREKGGERGTREGDEGG